MTTLSRRTEASRSSLHRVTRVLFPPRPGVLRDCVRLCAVVVAGHQEGRAHAHGLEGPDHSTAAPGCLSPSQLHSLLQVTQPLFVVPANVS